MPASGNPPPEPVTDGAGIASGLDFDAARAALDGLARRTPLLAAPRLSEELGREVFLKLECLQATGSFKVRGAAARLAALGSEERVRGVVACSSGNHGAAVAFVARRLGVPATIYVPEWVDPVKLGAIRESEAEVRLTGSTFDEAETRARSEAASGGRTYVSAYDDPWVIAGQGTVALEILEDAPSRPAAILVPLSGGGLAGGIAAALERADGPDAPRTVAVSAERAAVMLACLGAGRPVELAEEETVASALSGGIGLDNRWSFTLVRDLVGEHLSVTEPEIRAAMRYCAGELHLVVEGGGAVAVAALRSGRWRPPAADGPVVLVLTGGNVLASTLAGVLSEHEATRS